MNKILYVCSEAYPLIKTGGLGDVAGSLPIELMAHDNEVRMLLPAYPNVFKTVTSTKVIASTRYYNIPANILEATFPNSNLTLWLVDCPAMFDRPGGPYSDQYGNEWNDNAFRFAIFCHAAVNIALNELELNWQPDVVHCNDWQTALIPAMLKLSPQSVPTVFTIHNLAYQGIYSKQVFFDLHLPQQLWDADGLEFYDNFSFIKGGLYFADKITTVSPNYAQEILSPEFSYGLDGLLNFRKNDLSGILNGIDEQVWSPESDPLISQKFDKNSLDLKQQNKLALQEELGLPVDESVMMIGMVSRLVEQKGFNLILEALPKLVDLPVQFVILGTGETHYEIHLARAVADHPKVMRATIGYDETRAHRIEAACDVYMMPSIFEPCGLNQMYSLNYGSLPIVTPVGGLADTVHHADDLAIQQGKANGFVLEKISADALIDTIIYALELYSQKSVWQKIMFNAMNDDFSWYRRAEQYTQIYRGLKLKT